MTDHPSQQPSQQPSHPGQPSQPPASAHGWYVYAVVPAGAAVPQCDETILPGADLVLLRAHDAAPSGAQADLAALASQVPCGPFGTDPLESRAADPDWVAARAAAHHAVVASLASQCACLPLGYGTLFSSPASVRHWLCEHAVRLGHAMAAVAGRVEWSLTLAEDVAAHGAWVARQDAALLALQQTAAAAGPGTAFLLQRRLAQARDAARAAHCRQAAAAMAAHLAALGPRFPAAPGYSSASWSLLADKTDDVAEALRPAAASVSDTGLALRVTGPWPPYAFARAAWQEHARG